MPRESQQIPTAEQIRLPDGRSFRIADLTNQVRDRINHNLRTRQNRRATRTAQSTRPYKYTIEDRIWQRSAPVEAIAKRYGITHVQAQNIKYQSRYILEKLEIA